MLSSGINAQAHLRFQNGLALFWKLARNNQKQLSGDVDVTAESRRRDVAGVELSREWMMARLEFETLDSTFSSYRSLTESLSVFTPATWRWRALVTGTRQNLGYTDRDEDVSRVTLIGMLGRMVGTRGWLDVELDYRQERWSGATRSSLSDIKAFGVKSSFTWRFRRVEVELEGRLSRINRDGQEEDIDRLLLRVRRRF
jgi:hypothetical protein